MLDRVRMDTGMRLLHPEKAVLEWTRRWCGYGVVALALA